MTTMTMLFGLLMVLYGVINYLTADAANPSITALIPSFIGAPITLLGLVAALKDNLRKHAMHLAVVIAMIGALGGLGMGVLDLIKLGQDKPVNERAMTAKLAMGIACAVFIGVCVRSFIEARMAQRASKDAGSPPNLK
jgi:hypothetical protein